MPKKAVVEHFFRVFVHFWVVKTLIYEKKSFSTIYKKEKKYFCGENESTHLLTIKFLKKMENLEQIIKKLVHENVQTEVQRILDENKEMLSLEQAAQMLGLSRSYLYKQTAAGTIPHFKPMGKVIYFERSVLLDWIRSFPVPTKDNVSATANNYVNRNPLRV